MNLEIFKKKEIIFGIIFINIFNLILILRIYFPIIPLLSQLYLIIYAFPSTYLLLNYIDLNNKTYLDEYLYFVLNSIYLSLFLISLPFFIALPFIEIFLNIFYYILYIHMIFSIKYLIKIIKKSDN